MSLSDLAKTYDGSAHGATVTTTPSGLNVALTYNGGSALPRVPMTLRLGVRHRVPLPHVFNDLDGLALVLADAFLEKFGGDSVAEIRRNFDGYLAYLSERGYGERSL